MSHRHRDHNGCQSQADLRAIHDNEDDGDRTVLALQSPTKAWYRTVTQVCYGKHQASQERLHGHLSNLTYFEFAACSEADLCFYCKCLATRESMGLRPRHEVDEPDRYVPSSPTSILPACRKCNNDIGAMIYYGSRVAFVALAFCMYVYLCVSYVDTYVPAVGPRTCTTHAYIYMYLSRVIMDMYNVDFSTYAAITRIMIK